LANLATTNELVALLRKRKDALQLSDRVVEDIADMTPSHVSKLLALVPVKTLGRMSLTLLLGALGLKLIVVEEPNQARPAPVVKTRRELRQ